MKSRLAVRLTPRAKADAIDGWDRDEAGRPYLKVRVRAEPVDGAANAALERLIAKALGLPKSAVSVEKGGASRLKQLSVAGLEGPEVARRLNVPGS